MLIEGKEKGRKEEVIGQSFFAYIRRERGEKKKRKRKRSGGGRGRGGR